MKQYIKPDEMIFHDWLRKNKIKRFEFLHHEYPLGNASKLLEGDTRKSKLNDSRIYGAGVIGRIDVIFKYNKKTYIGEIKYMKALSDFWEAMKVIGYCEYYKWQTGTSNVFPAVLIPIESVKLEHQIVANKLKIKIFVIEKLNNGYLVKDMN